MPTTGRLDEEVRVTMTISVWVPVVVLALIAGTAVLVARDAGKRGQPGLLWGVVALITFPFGALAWLVVRALREPRSSLS
jgi:hypothetical protein